MSKLPGQTIRELCPVAPMEERQGAYGLTFGLGPAGYDVRIKETKWVWPGRFLLASTIEYFQMPSDVIATVHDKSTWIRCGVALQNTVIEPGWRGHLTIEVTKHGWRGRPRACLRGSMPRVYYPFYWLSRKVLSRWPVFRIYGGMPICQILFDRLEAPASEPYDGKYQDQPSGAQTAIFSHRSKYVRELRADVDAGFMSRDAALRQLMRGA